MIHALFDSPWYWWSAALLLLLLEIILPGAFLMWIGLGTVVVGIFLWLFPTAPVILQLFVLAVSIVGAVLVGIRWSNTEKSSSRSKLNQGLDQLVGQEAVVSQGFEEGRGRVRVEDSFYAAYAQAPLEVGQRVLITGVNANGLQVQACLKGDQYENKRAPI